MPRNYFSHILFILGMILLLAGCQPSNDAVEVPTETIAIPTDTPVPTETPWPTAKRPTVQLPTQTPTPVVQACTELVERDWEAIELDTKVVVHHWGFGLAYYDFATKEFEVLTDQFVIPRVSPDQKLIAAYSEETLKVTVYDSSRRMINRFKVGDVSFASWVNDYEILFFDRSDEMNIASIYNVFNGEKRIIFLDFPNIAYKNRMPGAGWFGYVFSPQKIVVHPSQGYLLYPATDVSLIDAYGYLVLWDQKAQKEITRLSNINKLSSEPVWSPDGEYYVVEMMGKYVDLGNIFLGDVEGNVTNITNLEDAANFYGFSWSPDGEKIAFWYYYVNEGEIYSDSHLSVLDVNSGELQVFCLEGYGKIHWSVDEKTLFVSILSNPSRGDQAAAIISLQEGWISVLGEDYEALGWMVDGE